MLSFKDIKRLAQETANETEPEYNAIVAKAMTKFMVKAYELVRDQERGRDIRDRRKRGKRTP